MTTPNTNIIMRVSLDEGDTEKRMAQLVLAIEANQKAQKELTKARELGTISAEEFAKESVKLTNQLITQRAEQQQLTKSVTAAAPETKKFGASLLDAAKGSNLLGGAMEIVTTAKEKYTVAANLAKAATAGEVTTLGALRAALLATGLGALVVVLGLVVTGLLKSQTATDFLSRKMAYLGGLIQPLINLGAELAEKLVAAADNPKQAFTDLVAFIETNLLNRLKAFGVIVDAVRNRDFTKLTDGVVQLGTGITDATARAKGLITQMGSSATATEKLRAESQQLLIAERALNVARDESRAKIEELKKLSDDSTKAVGVRAAAAKQAAAIENGLLAEQLRLQDAKIANLRASQALQRSLSNEDLDALAELKRERAQTAQESLTLQTELQNKINSLATESTDKRIALRKAELDAEAKAIDRQLKTVQVGSDEELKLLQAKLRNSYQAELNTKDLTVKGKREIDANYESNRTAQNLDFARKRVQAALQAAVDVGNAELAQQQAVGADKLRLQTEQIENQRQLSIAGLAANADNTAKIQAINAQAANQQRQAEYQEALRLLEEYLGNQRKLVEKAHDEGKLSETAYFHQIEAINKKSTDAQTVINADYRQDNTANQKQADADAAASARQHTAEVKQQEEARQQIKQATLDSAKGYTDTIINLFGEESEAGKAAMAVQKVLGVAQIALNLAKQLSANQLASAELGAIPIVGPALAVAYLAATDAAAVLAAAAQTAAILKLEQGGLAHVGGGTIAAGPRHSQGGIPLYHRGRPAGIEIEGGEPVLTRGVSQNPLLLSLASTVNQLAGGRALAPASNLLAPVSSLLPRYALGAVAYPALVRQQLQGGGGAGIDYGQMAKAFEKLNLEIKVSNIDNAMKQRTETIRLSSS